MAVTGAIFNKLIFGEIDSSDYGVYITGEAVFNAPKRAVTMVDVPGRNGALAIDQGHWENIEVTYPAGVFGSDKDDFRAAISEFRNALVSQIGYQRLEDSYHPDEYRIGLFFDGIEVEPAQYNTAGEFEIKFNCKPQRWLTSGEVAVSVSSGDTLTNPTQYESSPLLEFQATASGTIHLGDEPISFINAPIGTVSLPSTVSSISEGVEDVTLGGSYNDGDAFTIKGSKATFNFTAPSRISVTTFDSQDLKLDIYETSASGSTTGKVTFEDYYTSDFVVGTSKTVVKNSAFRSSGDDWSQTQTITLSIIYDGSDTVRMQWVIALTSGFTLNSIVTKSTYSVICDSTANSLEGDLYIDLDIGEAYRILDGESVSINNSVNLGSDLPTLAGGANEITYDNTITALSITPRWWKL